MMVDQSKGTILVVEDDNDSRDVITMILESLGYSVLSFSSGESIIEKISGKEITVAMLDIMMPKVDGYQVLELLRETPEFCQIPVFMVTAKDQQEELLEGYKYGADYYITKPFSSRQLEYALKLFLENEEEEPHERQETEL